jgi:hypothetical protein
MDWSNLPEGPAKMIRFLNTAGKDFFAMAIPMAGWASDQNVCKVSFERLLGDEGENVQKSEIIKMFEFISPDENIALSDISWRNVFSVDTVTWSGQRSQIANYWNDDVEIIFTDLGGTMLNEMLHV